MRSRDFGTGIEVREREPDAAGGLVEQGAVQQRPGDARPGSSDRRSSGMASSRQASASVIRPIRMNASPRCCRRAPRFPGGDQHRLGGVQQVEPALAVAEHDLDPTESAQHPRGERRPLRTTGRRRDECGPVQQSSTRYEAVARQGPAARCWSLRPRHGAARARDRRYPATASSRFRPRAPPPVC